MGTCAAPMAIMTAYWFWPRTAAMLTASSRLGIDSMMSTKRMMAVSTQPPTRPPTPNRRRCPSEGPDGEADGGGDDAVDQRLPGAEDHLGQQVGAEAVEAERVVLAGAGDAASGVTSPDHSAEPGS